METASLESLCSRISSGGTPSRKHPEYYSNYGHLWVKSQELLDRTIMDTDEKISDLGLANSAAKYFAEKTILVAMYGATVGQLAILKRPATVNQAICALEIDTTKADYRYVFYALMKTRSALTIQAAGAAQQNLNQSLIRNFEIPISPLGTQQKIACFLSAFDDLIENNRRRIEILEEMARLLYREWFVHFRFPGHEGVELVDSDLGPIPEGWYRKNLFELAEVRFGFSFRSKQFTESGKFRVIRIRDIPKNTTDTFTDEDAGERYEVHDGDTLIGMDGDFHMCRWADGLAYLNQRVARLRTKGPMNQLHLHLALEQPIHKFNETIIGTTVAHLGKRHLEQIWVMQPHPLILATANQSFQPIFELESNLRKQNRVLRKARDLLLPRLISGELDVSELDLDLETR
ncbi:MAG: restriction endonuclease subunit S [bacterium]|nr:restriction endonuclease subunit S [bacterium]